MSQTKAQLVEGKGDAVFDTDTLVVDSTNNRVGIGTTSGDTKVDVRGTSDSADSTLQIVGTNVSTLLLGQNSDGGVIRGQGGNNALAFWTGGSGDLAAGGSGSEKARIDSSGRLLVGTSTSSTGAIVEANGKITGTTINTYQESFSTTSTSTVTIGYTLGTTEGILIYVYSASSPSTVQAPGIYNAYRQTSGAVVSTVDAHPNVSGISVNGSTGAITLTPNTTSFRSWKVAIVNVHT